MWDFRAGLAAALQRCRLWGVLISWGTRAAWSQSSPGFRTVEDLQLLWGPGPEVELWLCSESCPGSRGKRLGGVPVCGVRPCTKLEAAGPCRGAGLRWGPGASSLCVLLSGGHGAVLAAVGCSC